MGLTKIWDRFHERFAVDWRNHNMKIPASLSKLREFILWPLGVLGRFVTKIWLAIFGRVAWTPPRWFSAWSDFSGNRPRTTASILIAAFLITCGSIWTWKWYQAQPKPHRVSATVPAIPVTKLDRELQFPPLIVRFSDPAARLEDLKKPSLEAVHLQPQITDARSWHSGPE